MSVWSNTGAFAAEGLKPAAMVAGGEALKPGRAQVPIPAGGRASDTACPAGFDPGNARMLIARLRGRRWAPPGEERHYHDIAQYP
jgi:hypothetical protein